MKTTSLHLKIEVKGKVKPSKMYELLSEVKKVDVYNFILMNVDKDFFQLPYKVKKLSKKARRNTDVNKYN